MKLPQNMTAQIANEMGQADLGDKRRNARLQRVVKKLARRPSASLPLALGDDAEVQAAYRLVNNPKVELDAVLAPHLAATAEQASKLRCALVLHDTTDCSFPTLDPAEIGYLQTGKAGFRLHLSLVVDADLWRRPVGVAHAEVLFRKRRSRAKSKGKQPGAVTAGRRSRELARWWRGMSASAALLAKCKNIIHIADREGDSYELMSSLLGADQRFVIRVRVNRRARMAQAEGEQWSKLWDVAASSRGILEREVPLSRRKAKTAPAARKTHPPRKMRTAKLRFSATAVTVPRPSYLHEPVPEEITVNVVQVVEVEAPAGERPVEWLLYTTEPIDTAEQVADVVDKYRTRWAIEELNAALKSGCAYESRQLESRHGLVTMLAMSLPIACRVLWLRSRARTSPKAPATDVLSSVQIEVLRALGSRKLSASATAEEALLAVAGLGGHLKRNGPPGWLVLHRGMMLLSAYEAGWLARGTAEGTDP